MKEKRVSATSNLSHAFPLGGGGAKWIFALIFLFALIFFNLNTINSAGDVTTLGTPWIALNFNPTVLSGNHTQFMTDFEEMIRYLKERGFNTIIFDMEFGKYHFTFDPSFENYSYSSSTNFTMNETKQMAGIVRDNGMQVVVGHQILTHEVGGIFDDVYPEYMLKFANGSYSTHTRDPFNETGEEIVFGMIDELIEAFTTNGTKPEGFHIQSDELNDWYDNPVSETGMSSAEIYAMVINNSYNHIKENNSNMEVIIWSDMLDGNKGGGTKNTSNAINLISKDIIIADWKYTQTTYNGYDNKKNIFTSVINFTDKGFRVWPASWKDANATTDLIWTENMEQARTERIVGHIYTTWISYIVPELKSLLQNESYVVPNVITSNETEKQNYRDIADSINQTIDLIGFEQCRGTDYFCGEYPNCEDAAAKDGYYNYNSAHEFRDYSCSDNSIIYNNILDLNDYISYWKFDGNANDETGINNGTLKNTTFIFNDIFRGRVAIFDSQGYIDFGNNLGNIINNATWSFWIKMPLRTNQGIIGKYFPSTGKRAYYIQSGTSTATSLVFSRSIDGLSVGYFSWSDFFVDNNWTHVALVYQNGLLTAYSNGISEGTQNITIIYNSSAANFTIGAVYFGANYFNGSIDDVMIFDRALSPAEIQKLYLDQNDFTSPEVSFSCSPSSVAIGHQTNCACSAVDDNDNDPVLTYTSNPSTSQLGTFTATCTATDYAGNAKNRTTTYTVTPAAVGGGYPSSSISKDDFNKGIEKSLGENWKTNFKIGAEKHELKVDKIENNSATITISSNPFTVTLFVGDEKKYDINEDNYYDLYLKLNSVKNKKADIFIKIINETFSDLSENKQNESREEASHNLSEWINPIRFSSLKIALLLVFALFLVILIIIKRHYIKYFFCTKIYDQ